MATLRWHPPTHPPDEPAPDLKAATHRSRAALKRVLTDPHDERAWDLLADFYDEAADGWDEWAQAQPGYAAPVTAGLGRTKPAHIAVEVSCGSGQATEVLDGHADVVLATDTSLAMLQDAPPALPHTRYAVADVRRLPVRTGVVDLLVGLNAVPYTAEFARVLRPSGQLLWCTSFGPGTPLYVEPERLVDLMGPGWRADAGRAGHGEWLLLTRAG